MNQLLINTLDAGQVTRYHAVPSVRSQTLAHHQWSVAVLALYITALSCSRDLLVECMLHDTGELFTGDIPFTVKRDHPRIKEFFNDLEDEERTMKTICPPVELGDREAALLKICDTLEGLLWCYANETVRGPVKDRWHEAYRVCQGKYASLLTPEEWNRADSMFHACGGPHPAAHTE